MGGRPLHTSGRLPRLVRNRLERKKGSERTENCAYLCKQLITLSISTSLLYNGDKNLIIQRHANVAILASTHSLLITMPLTLCNLLCELGHIKNIIPITTSRGSPEDRTKVIGIWKGTCWGLHCCEANTGSWTQWPLSGFAEQLSGN